MAGFLSDVMSLVPLALVELYCSMVVLIVDSFPLLKKKNVNKKIKILLPKYITC